jgi:hypothetical protein
LVVVRKVLFGSNRFASSVGSEKEKKRNESKSCKAHKKSAVNDILAMGGVYTIFLLRKRRQAVGYYTGTVVPRIK